MVLDYIVAQQILLSVSKTSSLVTSMHYLTFIYLGTVGDARTEDEAQVIGGKVGLMH